MNRRQFLGRFFQAVLTSYTSNSVYGIYHSWRQYHIAPYTLNINLKYMSNSSMHNLPPESLDQTIIAVYDSNGIMVYCTAYYDGSTLINECRYSISLKNMPGGKYTIKCLCYGVGVCQGESGTEVVVTLPEIDRATLQNNNYGYIPVPSGTDISVDFIFGMEGMYFTAEAELENIGSGYYFDDPKFGVQRIVSTAPSYEKCKALAEAAAAEAGLSYTYNYYAYGVDISRVEAPLTDEYRFSLDDKYYIHSKIKAVFMGADGTETDITTIDLKYYYSEGSASYWNICNANGLEYDPETYYADESGYDWSIQDSGMINTDGSYESYTYALFRGYSELIRQGNDILAIVGSTNAGWNGVSGMGSFNYSIRDVSSRITFETPKEKIGDTVYSGTPMAKFNIQVLLNYDLWMYGDSALDKSFEEPCVSGSTVKDHNEKNLPVVKRMRDDLYNNYWLPALAHYGVDPEQDVPWIKTGVQDPTKYSQQIPLSAFFGKLTADKSLYPVNYPPTSGDILEPYAVANPYTGAHVYWGLKGYRQRYVVNNSRDQPTRKMHPMLEGYTANLSEYDPNGQCDNSHMWKTVNGRYIFMRQTTIPIDMGAIPDHQITH